MMNRVVFCIGFLSILYSLLCFSNKIKYTLAQKKEKKNEITLKFNSSLFAMKSDTNSLFPAKQKKKGKRKKKQNKLSIKNR